MGLPVYRVLVLGTGFARRVQIPVFMEHPRFEVAAVASGRAERAREAAEQFGIPHHGADWRSLLEDIPVDTVSVVTPVVEHHAQAVAALEAGKHLLLEKPVAMNRAEAESIRDLARATDSKTAVNHEFRYRPDVLTLKRMLEDGRLGDLRGIEIRSYFPMWADPEAPTFGWLSEAKSGGGVLGAMGSHNLDFVDFLTGRSVREVCGRAWTVVPERRGPDGNARAVSADDSVFMVLDLHGGVRARIDIAAALWWSENTIRVYGSRGTVGLDDSWNIHLRHPDGRTETKSPDPDFAWSTGESDVRKPLFSRFLDRFALRCDGERVEDLATMDEGVEIMRTLDAVREGGL